MSYDTKIQGKEVIQMKTLRNLSNLLKPKNLSRVDDAIVSLASKLQDKIGPFKVDDLLGHNEFDEGEFNSVTSVGVFLEMDDFTEKEIESLIEERLEILATRPTNRLLCKAEIAGYYYVI